MRKMSDAQLQNQTQIFRELLKKEKTLEDILPEAFATVREADYRVLGLYPYDVQVLGAIMLSQGSIAEMRNENWRRKNFSSHDAALFKWPNWKGSDVSYA